MTIGMSRARIRSLIAAELLAGLLTDAGQTPATASAADIVGATENVESPELRTAIGQSP